jgi:hypothetical protein
VLSDILPYTQKINWRYSDIVETSFVYRPRSVVVSRLEHRDDLSRVEIFRVRKSRLRDLRQAEDSVIVVCFGELDMQHLPSTPAAATVATSTKFADLPINRQ